MIQIADKTAATRPTRLPPNGCRATCNLAFGQKRKDDSIRQRRLTLRLLQRMGWWRNGHYATRPMTAMTPARATTGTAAVHNTAQPPDGLHPVGRDQSPGAANPR